MIPIRRTCGVLQENAYYCTKQSLRQHEGDDFDYFRCFVVHDAAYMVTRRPVGVTTGIIVDDLKAQL